MLPGTTLGCVFVLLKREDAVSGLMLVLEAGVGCSPERAAGPCTQPCSVALFKPLLTLDLVPESFLIIFKLSKKKAPSLHWKAGGGNQEGRVEQMLL